MDIRVSRSGRKHKMSVARIAQALRNGHLVSVVGDAARYVGTTTDGIELEIVLVPDDRNPDRFVVIHAMPTEFRKRKSR